jgi:hypothetical protein
MNSMMATGRKIKVMAGFAALVATLFTTAGTLVLADHYARAAGNGQVQMAGNLAKGQAAPTLHRCAENGRIAEYS